MRSISDVHWSFGWLNACIQQISLVHVNKHQKDATLHRQHGLVHFLLNPWLICFNGKHFCFNSRYLRDADVSLLYLYTSPKLGLLRLAKHLLMLGIQLFILFYHNQSWPRLSHHDYFSSGFLQMLWVQANFWESNALLLLVTSGSWPRQEKWLHMDLTFSLSVLKYGCRTDGFFSSEEASWV